MADKLVKRGVTVYIDGSQIKNSVQAISTELNKLIRDQKKMTIGSDDYVAHAKKIGQLNSVLQKHKLELANITDEYNNATKGLKGFFQRLETLPGVVGWIGRSFTGLADSIEMMFQNRVMLGITAVMAIFSGMIALVKNGKEFAKAVSQLSAITGATGADLDYLKNSAKDLARQFGKSSTEIVEAMKLVGSAKPELLSNVSALKDMTSAVITLSKATGMDLTEATAGLATIMNQFGMSAAESEKAINVLAAGSKYGAVEVDYLKESISKVGTIAKSAGISLEQTTAAMELFGEKGVKAEIAGNGFKKVLIELQGDTKNYTNGVFDLNKAIANNQDIAGNNIELQKKFGQEFFNIAQILFQNKDRFNELSKQVTGTNVAFEQAAIASDNLSGDVDKMKASWDAFMLSLEDGQGPITKAFRSLIQWAKDAMDVMYSLNKSPEQKEKDLVGQYVKNRIDSLKKDVSGMKEGERTKYLNDEIIASRHLYQQKQARMKQIEEEIRQNKQLGGAWAENNKKLEEEYSGLGGDVNRLVAYTNAVAGLRAEFKKPVTAPSKLSTNGKTATGDKVKDKDPLASALKEKEEFWKKDEELTKRQYAEGIIDEQTYEQQLFENRLNALNAKLEIQKQFGVSTTETEIQISDVIIAERKRCDNEEQKLINKNNKDTEEKAKVLQKILEDAGIDYLDNLKTKHQIELDVLKDAFDKKLISEEVYLKAKKFLEDKYESEKEKKDKQKEKKETQLADAIAQIAQNTSGAISGFQNAELQAVETKYQKQIEAAQKAGKDTTAIEEQKNKEMAAIRAKNADALFVIQAAEIAATTASAAIKTFDNTVTWGGPVVAGIAAAATVAYGLSQLAQAEAAREAAKEGYADGGFTAPGDKYQPAGVVHAGEFVANQEAVGNPIVRPLLNMIDAAQRHGTISSLSRADISKALRFSPGYSDGGYTSGGKTVVSGSHSAVTDLYIGDVAKALNRLNDHLDKGIVARAKVSGNDGIAKAMDDYNNLINNASR